MGSFSLWHWIIVLVVVLLLFGRGRISDVMGEVAKGINSFKKGLKEEDEVATKTIDQNATETVKSTDKSAAS